DEFRNDVDRPRVVQAKHVMVRTTATVSMKDGIRVAVKEMKSNGISSVFVVDGDRRLQGIVTIDDAIQARRENKDLSEILRRDYHTADPEETIQDLIPKATESRFPIAVVDESGKLLGIILRVSGLAGWMAEAGGNGAERSAAD